MTWSKQERKNAAGRWESHCNRKGCDWSAPGDYPTRQAARRARWDAGHRTWHYRQEQAKKHGFKIEAKADPIGHERAECDGAVAGPCIEHLEAERLANQTGVKHDA